MKFPKSINIVMVFMNGLRITKEHLESVCRRRKSQTESPTEISKRRFISIAISMYSTLQLSVELLKRNNNKCGNFKYNPIGNTFCFNIKIITQNTNTYNNREKTLLVLLYSLHRYIDEYFFLFIFFGIQIN